MSLYLGQRQIDRETNRQTDRRIDRRTGIQREETAYYDIKSYTDKTQSHNTTAFKWVIGTS